MSWEYKDRNKLVHKCACPMANRSIKIILTSGVFTLPAQSASTVNPPRLPAHICDGSAHEFCGCVVISRDYLRTRVSWMTSIDKNMWKITNIMDFYSRKSYSPFLKQFKHLRAHSLSTQVFESSEIMNSILNYQRK